MVRWAVSGCDFDVAGTRQRAHTTGLSLESLHEVPAR